MNAFPNGIVFCRRAERVPTHRMEHIETLEPLVPRPAIRQDITAPVSYGQSGTRRVRKHIETIIFRAWIIVLRLVKMVRSPVFAPLRLDFPRAVVLCRHKPKIITYRPECVRVPLGPQFHLLDLDVIRRSSSKKLKMNTTLSNLFSD